MRKLFFLIFSSVIFLPVSAQTVRSSTGATLASIVPTRDLFRTDLGGLLNPNMAGSFGTGYREINWDGVPDAFAAPNNLPANFFNVNSPRGVVFSTPGTGFQVSANASNPTSTPVEFGNINASYPGLFAPFSPQRLFTTLGSTITDVNFFFPGSTTPAVVTGFGAVFSDVDLVTTTSIQLFDQNNVSLGTFFVPATSGNETFSFLGISYSSAIISRVRIISGNTVPGPNETVANDVVAMDDFIYGEPIGAQATIRSISGANAAAITPPRDQYRSDLGGGTIAGANGGFGGLRREINWDGVPDALSEPNNLPGNFFNVNSPRGIILSTPGTALQVSANAGSPTPVLFSYSNLFTTFSPQRLFTALGSNITDVTFFIPGTTTPALTKGFGSIFTDVDLAGLSSIQYFDANYISLGTYNVPHIAGNQTLSFLGLSYPTTIISRVRLLSGNIELGAGINETALVDLVVMDDFIYGEPVAPVCTPSTTVTEDPASVPGGLASFSVNSGPGSVTVDHINSGTGLQSFTVFGIPINAVVTIPPFTPGTFNPVTSTFTVINPALPVDITFRAANSTQAIFIRAQCGTCTTPTVNAVANQILCNGTSTTAINFSGSSPTSIYNWTNNNTSIGLAASGTGNIASFVATNATTTPVIATVTVTPTDGVCVGTPRIFTITVNPTPNAVATPSSQTICSAASITTIALTGNVSSTVFNWTRDNAAAVTGIPGNGSGNISGTLTNITASPVTVTFTITPTASACPGPTSTATVLVNPTPNAVATPSSQNICNATAITPIVLTGGVAGTTFAWTRDNAAAVTGIPGNGSGNISGTLTNITASPVTVTFTITPTANGCVGPTSTATVLVNPTPTAVATPASQTICNNTAITPIVLSGSVSGTTFTWTRNSTATVTGIAASGSGSPISGSLSNTTNAAVTVTFMITPTANGCPGPTTIATVLIAPTPTVDPVANQTVCNGTMTAPVNFSGPVSGTVYNWTNSTPSIGLAASGTGNIPAFTGTNASTSPVSGTVTVTPQVSVVSASGGITLPPQSATFTGLVRGYWFTAPTSFIMTSLLVPTDASSGNQNVAVVRFNGATPPPAFPTTTNAFTTLFLSQNNASGTSIPVSIAVNAGDVIGVLGNRNDINSYGVGPASTTIAGMPVTLTRMGMQFALSSNAPQSIFQATGSISRVLFNYEVSTTCTGPQRTFTITVNPTPTITCPANMTVASTVGACTAVVNYAPTVTGTPTPTLSYVLTGATTGSGSGTGSGTAFRVGVTTVTITATNICATVTCSFTITVTDSQLPVITLQPANRTVCAGSNAIFSVAAVTAPSTSGPLSYQWQMWNGSAWVNITGAMSSTYPVNGATVSQNTSSYRVQVIGLCTTVTSIHATLYVNPLPTINLTTSIPPNLLPTQVLTITATTAPSGGTYVWRKNGTVIAGASGSTLPNLTVSDIGTYNCTYTDPNGCVSTSSNIVITGQQSNNLYVYPVPNNGVFNVRFYNQSNEEMTLKVFDARGAEVYNRKIQTTIPYTTINVDLTTNRILTSGVYVVDLRRADGSLAGSRKIIVYK